MAEVKRLKSKILDLESDKTVLNDKLDSCYIVISELTKTPIKNVKVACDKAYKIFNEISYEEFEFKN